MVVDMLSLRPAAEKPPFSTTWLKTSRLVSRSMGSSASGSLLQVCSNRSAVSAIALGHSQAGFAKPPPWPSGQTARRSEPQFPWPQTIHSEWIILPIFTGLSTELQSFILRASRQETVMSEMPRSESFREATEIAPEVAPAAAVPGKRSILKRAGLLLALLATTAAGGYFGHDYFTYGRYL